MALFNSKVDENADPKIQIQQAIEDAQRQHQAPSASRRRRSSVTSVSSRCGLNRQLADIEKLQANVPSGTHAGRPGHRRRRCAKATDYNNAAEAFAAQLVTAEQSVRGSQGAARPVAAGREQAKKAVEQNAMVLQQKIAERTEAAVPAQAGQDAGTGQRLAAGP